MTLLLPPLMHTGGQCILTQKVLDTYTSLDNIHISSVT